MMIPTFVRVSMCNIGFIGFFLMYIDIMYLCRHTASVAAGNHGIPVVVAGNHFGKASGMAPRSQ